MCCMEVHYNNPLNGTDRSNCEELWMKTSLCTIDFDKFSELTECSREALIFEKSDYLRTGWAVN